MIPNSIHFSKHFVSFGKWVSMSQNMWSRPKTTWIHLNIQGITCWLCSSTLGGIFQTKGMTKSHTKAPQYVMKVVLLQSYGVIQIWWYPKNPSKNEYLATLSQTLSIEVMNMYSSFGNI
jgi:hypothetical protein